MSLNYTPLRHKMLADIEAGLYSVYVGFDWNLRLRNAPGTFVRSDVARSLHEAGLVAPTRLASGTQRDAYLTSVGQTLLAEWTAQRGEPK